MAPLSFGASELPPPADGGLHDDHEGEQCAQEVNELNGRHRETFATLQQSIRDKDHAMSMLAGNQARETKQRGVWLQSDHADTIRLLNEGQAHKLDEGEGAAQEATKQTYLPLIHQWKEYHERVVSKLEKAISVRDNARSDLIRQHQVELGRQLMVLNKKHREEMKANEEFARADGNEAIARLKAEYDQKLSSLRVKHDSAVSALEQKYEAKLSSFRVRHEKIITSLGKESEKIIDDLQEQFKQIVHQKEETHNKRVSDLEEKPKNNISRLQEEHENETLRIQEYDTRTVPGLVQNTQNQPNLQKANPLSETEAEVMHYREMYQKQSVDLSELHTRHSKILGELDACRDQNSRLTQLADKNLSELQALGAHLASKDRAIDQYKEDLTSERKTLSGVVAANNILKAREDNLQEQLRTKEKEAIHLKNQYDEHIAKRDKECATKAQSIKELENQLASRDAETRDLKRTIDEMKIEHITIASELRKDRNLAVVRQTDEKARYEKELGKQQRSIKEASKKLEELQRRYDTATADLQGAHDELQVLKAQRSSATVKMEEFQAHETYYLMCIDELKGRISGLKARLTQRDGEIASLEAARDQAENRAVQYNDAAVQTCVDREAEDQKRIDDLEIQLAERDDELARLQSVRDEFKKLQAEYNSATQDFQSREMNHISYVDSLNVKIAKQEGAFKLAQAEIETIKAQYSSDIQKYRLEKAEYDEYINQLKVELAKCNGDLQSARDEMETLKAQHDSFLHTMEAVYTDRLDEYSAECDKSIAVQKDIATQIENFIDGLKAQLAERDAEIARLHSVIATTATVTAVSSQDENISIVPPKYNTGMTENEKSLQRLQDACNALEAEFRKESADLKADEAQLQNLQSKIKASIDDYADEYTWKAPKPKQGRALRGTEGA